MSEQTLSRLLTFSEFAPQCLEAAECWINNHPQGDAEPNDTFTLVVALRNCIDRGMSETLRAQQWRETTQVTGYCPVCAERENPQPLTGSIQIGQVVTGKIVAADAEHGLVSIKWEPKGEHHG